MRVLLVLAFVSGCMRMRDMKPGTVVPVAELYTARADLRGYAMRELAAGRPARAFYVLEVEKTRTFAAQQLARHDPHDGFADLRPIMASLYDLSTGTHTAQRGFSLVPGAASASIARDGEARDRLFWRDLSLREARFAAQVPYGLVTHGHIGAVSVEEARLLFAPGEAYVSYAIAGDRVVGMVVVGGRLIVRPLAVSLGELRRRVTALVGQVAHVPANLADDTWRQPAAEVADALLAPFPELRTAAIHALYVSPDGVIAAVPFAALVEGDHLLIDRVRVALLPSASVYRKALERPLASEPPRVLAVGNPIYPAGVATLPFTEREATTVARIFDGSLLLHGETATEANVVDAIRDHDILHFATHGVLLGRALPGASSLLLTADADHDGFLSAAEIATLDLGRVYLAVLSACESSVADADTRSADLASLTGAFLIAGVPSVIGTLWQIDDEATTALVVQFYERFLDAGAGEALRSAQRAMHASPRYHHPYFWAAFVLFGWDK